MSESLLEEMDLVPQADDLAYNKPDLDAVLAALEEARREQRQTVSPTLVYGLSELTPDEWRQVEGAWRRLPGSARRQVIQALHEASEAMFELSYHALGRHSLDDDDDAAREAAIELLWTDDSESTMQAFMRLARHDSALSVRIAAVSGLGRFVLLGEYGNVAESLALEAQRLLLSLHGDERETLELRRRALESVANSSHADLPDLIRAAYNDGNHELMISAIFAMGRTCSQAWSETLLGELESADNEAVYEAVNACGQIQILESVPRLGELAQSDDSEIQVAAIWALGEIGGPRAFRILSQLDEQFADRQDDEDVSAVLDEALAAAGLRHSLVALGDGLDLD